MDLSTGITTLTFGYTETVLDLIHFNLSLKICLKRCNNIAWVYTDSYVVRSLTELYSLPQTTGKSEYVGMVYIVKHLFDISLFPRLAVELISPCVVW